MLIIAGCGDKESGSETETKPSGNLASQFFSGPLSPEAKFTEMKQKAEAGSAKDQLGLARRYYAGDGVAKNNAKAAEWYEKAAEQGSDFAQYKLAVMYDKGEGVPKDTAKAVEWWKKSAAQGNRDAQESLERLSANGQ
ncbi:MAG: tetratricopeptide repeat protein [Gallionella sp.]|nr:tetratricopeptide repeat protein [Gallionella sp.]